MAGNLKVRLSIPRQDLEDFALFQLSTEAAEEWYNSLPVANTQRLADLLARALSDLNRVEVPPETRFGIIEVLRPGIDIALAGICKKYLNQPLVMPTDPARIAATADQLFTATATAYTIVAVETIRRREAIVGLSPARLACAGIQRALHYTGLRVLQAFQLYRPLDVHCWHTLHQLYALAEGQQLTELLVLGTEGAETSIKSSYMQSVLLGCSKPNQLRQSDLTIAHRALADVGSLVDITTPPQGVGLFFVDLTSDQPPLYSKLIVGRDENGCRYIDTAGLVDRLRTIKDAGGDDAAGTDGLRELPRHLLDHLTDALGHMSQRNFSRHSASSAVRVCLGLSCAHYHVAGRRDFSDFLDNDNLPIGPNAFSSANPFMNSLDQVDIWQRANPDQDYVRNEWLPGQTAVDDSEHRIDLDWATRRELLEEVEVKLPLDQRYPVFKIQLADASPGGYCLSWDAELPKEVHAGDVVSIMEEQGQQWTIAVIRWLSQMEQSRSLIGLELLSPGASAWAALVHQKNGKKGAPMRALLLPEIKLVGQPSTLIIPRSSFRDRQRVTLVNRGDLQTVQLTRQIAATASYSQYEFRYIRELGDVLAKEQRNPLDSPYDSLWSNI